MCFGEEMQKKRKIDTGQGMVQKEGKVGGIQLLTEKWQNNPKSRGLVDLYYVKFGTINCPMVRKMTKVVDKEDQQ